MPQLIAGAAIAGGVSSIFTAGSFFSVFATTIAAGFLGHVLTPLPSNLNNGAPQNRQVGGRSTLASRRYVLGRVQLAAANLAYGEITGDQGEHLHLVLPFCQGPLTAIEAILFDDEVVGARDGDGVVIEGTFERQPDGTGGWAEIARIHEALGSDSKTADADLVAESDGRWTTDHRGRGIADLVIRLRRDAQDRLYPSGAPTVRIIALGNAVYDPRDAGTRFSVNPALLIRWLLTLPRPDGFGVDAAEVNDTLVAAAANICEERVAVDTYSSPLFTANATTDTLTFASREMMIGLGDGVRVVGPGPLPTGLSAGVTYYAIRPTGLTCKLATTYANAIAGVAIDIISAGSGDMTLSHIDQARYQCSGLYEADQLPRQVLSALLASMAGVLWYAEGKFHLRAGAWLTPRSQPITERDLAGSLQIQTCTPWRDLFNSVRGTFTDPNQDFQPTDFKAVTDSTYVTEDGAELPKDIDFQWVDNPLRAQRLAQINLRRARQGQILTLQCKPTVLDVGLWDTVKVSIAKLGLSEDTFRVIGWDMQQGQATTLVLILQSETSSVFGWSATDGDTVTPKPDLVLPNPRVVDPPSDLTMASGTAHLLRLTDGTILSRIAASWTASPDPNVGSYEIQWAKATETGWPNSVTIPASQLGYSISPVEDGIGYYVRVRAVRLGNSAKSDWIVDGHTVVGKTAAPTAPTSIGITQLPNALQISWTTCPDADYRETEVWEASTNDRSGATQVAALAGTALTRSGFAAAAVRYYWVRHVDSSGNVSSWYPSSATGGVSGTAGADPGNEITHDFTGFLAGGASGYLSGAGYWLGYAGGAYKMHLGNPSGQHIKWDGTNFTVVGGVVAGALTVNAAGSIAIGATDYLTGSGFWAGYSGSAYKMHLGNPSGAHIKWDGFNLTVAGGLVTGSVQVSSSGNVRGGQTAYNTGTGFWIGDDSGTFKFSIGNPSGNRLGWDGSTLTVIGTINGIGQYAAGTTVTLAQANTERNSASTTYVKVKEFAMPKSGTVRVSWNMKTFSGTTGYAQVFVNGVGVGVEKTTTSVTNEAKSDDIAVNGGDLLQLYYKNSPGSGNGTFVSSVIVQATVGEVTTVLQD